MASTTGRRHEGVQQMAEDDPNSGGLSRKTIEQELENCLAHLGRETLDLYQIHRWDPETPTEVNLRALTDAVRHGRVRYIGASSMWTYQLATALHQSERLGLERFRDNQNHYSLVYREEEREMLPYYVQEDIGVLPWSPLAKGYLARPHEEIRATERGKADDLLHDRLYDEKGSMEINDRIQELADQ